MTDVEMVEAYSKRMRDESIRGGWSLRMEAHDDAVWLVAAQYGWSFTRAGEAVREWSRRGEE